MNDIKEHLFDAETIAAKVGELGAQISTDYANKEVVLICILKAAALFASDLMRHITVPVTIDFIQAASYGASTSSSGTIQIKQDISTDISGKHVLLVDTIIDTGETFAFLFKKFGEMRPASLKAVALLDKRSRRIKDISMAYIGFEITDRFVVGYGMDWRDRYRNLPYIAVLKHPAA